jgi:periplasmic divalent cation tolerance protein
MDPGDLFSPAIYNGSKCADRRSGPEGNRTHLGHGRLEPEGMKSRGAGRGRGRPAIVVLVTAASARQAGLIGRALVRAELAACVNIVPGIRSIFRWEGKVSEEREVLLIMKSRADLFGRLAAQVKRLHSYQVPEVIAFPIVYGTDDYLAWIEKSTRKSLK